MMKGTLIPLAGLFECVSQRTGKRYFSGYLGKAKVVLLEVPEAEREEGRPTWTLFIAERSEKPSKAAAPSPRKPSQPASRPVANPASAGTNMPARARRAPVGRVHARPFDDDLPSYLKGS